MPVYKRKDVTDLTRAVADGSIAPAYLIFGERYLCQQVSNDLIGLLLPDEQQRAANLTAIDGDQEVAENTLRHLRTYSLFPGRQVVRVMDSKLFFSKTVAKTIWDKAGKAYSAKKFDQAVRYLGQLLGLADMALQDWDAQGVDAISSSRWQSLFGFAKPDDVNWVKEAIAGAGADLPQTPAKSDAADLYAEALTAGVPPNKTLILVAEAVDKRKKLYKLLEKTGVIIDLSVDTGGTTAARKDQEAVLTELARQTLAEFGKKLAPALLPRLLERVGFHPVALVREVEKLALSVGDAPSISRQDLDAMVGRTREEALYEFTEAFGEQDLARALQIMSRILENGTHPLVLISGLRNSIRKLLLVRSLQEQSRLGYKAGMSFPAFQKGFLASLKAERGALPAPLSGHPYVVYKSFQHAERFSLIALQQSLAGLLKAEHSMKSSALPDALMLENFLFSFFIGPDNSMASAP